MANSHTIFPHVNGTRADPSKLTPWRSSTTLFSLPLEILEQILRLVFIPEKLLVFTNGDRAVVRYWSHVPAKTAFLADPSIGDADALAYTRFDPSAFIITKRIYTVIWNLLWKYTNWQFSTVESAYLLLYRTSSYRPPVIPLHIQQYMRHISVVYRSPEDEHGRGSAVPNLYHHQNLIKALQGIKDLKQLDIILPWPDWEHQVTIVQTPLREKATLDSRNITYENVSSTMSQGYGIRVKKHRQHALADAYPWTDLRLTTQIIYDLCWQGVETRCWLWGINVARFGPQHLATATAKLQLMGYLQTDYLHSHDMSSEIEYKRAGTFEVKGTSLINAFFQTVDPEDVLWKHRMLTISFVDALGCLLGRQRVKFKVSFSDLEKHFENTNGSAVVPGDICAGIRPVVIIG